MVDKSPWKREENLLLIKIPKNILPNLFLKIKHILNCLTTIQFKEFGTLILKISI